MVVFSHRVLVWFDKQRWLTDRERCQNDFGSSQLSLPQSLAKNPVGSDLASPPRLSERGCDFPYIHK